MLNSFNYRQNGFNDKLSVISYITRENKKTQSNFEKNPHKDTNIQNNSEINELYTNIQNNYEINENSNTTYCAYASTEWSTNIYSFDKSYIKSLISYDAVLNRLLKNYFNMLENKIKVLFKRRRYNKTRYSANKIYTSRAELNHTNTNIFITLYVYNKQKYSIERSIRIVVTWVKIFFKWINGEKIIIKIIVKNRLFHFLKNNFFLFKKYNIAFFKTTNNIIRYLLVNLRRRYLNFYNIPSYNVRWLRKIFRLQRIFFTSTKIINFNKAKYNSLTIKWKNFGLISLIEKLYNKKVEIDLVELKNIHLNSDVFSSAVALKLRDRKNKAVRILRKAILQMVRIPDLHTLITFDDNTEEMNKNNIIKTIKQQVVSGVRFEASGRLTRRLTAMRAVFKYRYAGSLKNIRSSFNNKPSTMLRGYVKSNLQYTLINSKTRNGTFGLKGWVSSHGFMGLIAKRIVVRILK